ncbi:hypothetical protein FD967_01705 [Polynucleobacter sp. JS-Mosq-20-D10]|uniref:hypothetical protein n=1 Tax=Polynucleobacter sp. JS-Mosq-20-D10 TaxID=2576922 RepID=UPI001BFE8841|nr:hypothetical protein [Polynucleobacter sp. JS-Mosq-20-D10]QWE00785.1 hypothetical protein FD967_01705 [Polynucleobacter sp. JS-Mosq-20-D10]
MDLKNIYFKLRIFILSYIRCYELIYNKKLITTDYDLYLTSFWYKNAGFIALSNGKYLFNGFFKFEKPFWWRKIDYGTFYILGPYYYRLISITSLFIVLSTAKIDISILIIILISPLFINYIIIDIKPEIPFIICAMSLYIISSGNDYINFILAIISSFNITAGILLVPYLIKNLVQNNNFVLITIVILNLLYTFKGFFISKEKVTSISKLLGNKQYVAINKPSKLQVISFLILIYFTIKSNDYGYLYFAIIILFNGVIFRFMDSSSERRILFLCIISYAANIDYIMIFLLIFPIGYLGRNLNYFNKDIFKLVSDVDRMIKYIQDLKNLSKKKESNLIFYYSGGYNMDNRNRFLWYLFEYECRNFCNVIPSIFLENTSAASSWLILYKKMDELKQYELNDFLSEYDYVVCDANVVEKLSEIGFSIKKKLGQTISRIFCNEDQSELFLISRAN